MVEAAKFLGVHFYTLRYLVEADYLETTEFAETQRKTTRARFIPREAAIRFQAEFVPAQELAERLGTHVRVLVPRLAVQGVTTAISNADAGRYYYRTSEVAALLGRRAEERRPRR
jgi:hypothetical protein